MAKIRSTSRSIFAFVAVLVSFTIAMNVVYALPSTVGQDQTGKAFGFIAMAVSVGLCSVGAGYALGKVGAASIASITEKPELFGRTVIYVGMAEGIAIYGLLIAFLVWISL